MAQIRNSISLADRMSPTLRAILKAMDSNLRVMRQLDKAANNGAQSKAYRRAEKDIQRANNALKKMSNYTQMASRAARDGERAYSNMGNAAGRVAQGFAAMHKASGQFLQSLASGVYLAQKLANLVGGVMETADTSRSQVARLGLYNTSSYSNEELYGQVFATAMATRSKLDSTADLVNKMLVGGVFAGDTAVQSAIGTAGIINRALVAGGGTAEQNDRALLQLTQGLASGVLQGDELRSIREQAPYLASVLAEGLAKVDEQFAGIGIGDLKKLGAEGELTADRVVKAFWAMQDEVNQDFEAMPKTFGQATTALSSIWQYFLWMLSGTDAPLGKINDMLWQFVDYLQSPAGLELLDSVARGIDFAATAITGAMTAVGDFVVYLQNNTPVAEALFLGLAAAATVAAVTIIASWVATAWPILLVLGLVALVSWAFLDAGYTMQQVVGSIIGGILWLGAALWNVCVGIVEILWMVLMTIVLAVEAVLWIILLGVQGIFQILTWAVLGIITVIWFIWEVIMTVIMLLVAGFQSLLIAGATIFFSLAQIVLGILGAIAEAIDAVFGTKLADTVWGWSADLTESYTAFVDTNNPDKTVDKINERWSNFGSGVADLFTNEEYNLYDEIANVGEGGLGLLKDTNSFIGDGMKFLEQGYLDTGAAFDTGYDWGAGLVDGMSDFSLGLPSQSVLDQFNKDGVTVNGGYLDGINSDVNISDEDLKLLRDMTARDYLLQLQTITPVANVTFGDVRETADVGKIVEVIEQMVEEQMATSLVS